MKGWPLLAALAVVLGACSFAPLIESDSLDYGDTLDAVSNQLLVTNILRARDHAPLHFADLSALRAQFQVTASAQAILPFGPFSRTQPVVAAGTGVGSLATRASNTDIFSLQTAPSFDFSPLDTQEFTRGILTPIDAQVAKYYFDRDLPQELLMFLFIDRVTPAGSGFSSPEQTSEASATNDHDYVNDPEQPVKFAAFAAWVSDVFGGAQHANDRAQHANDRVIVANSYLRQIGPPMPGPTPPKIEGAGGKGKSNQPNTASESGAGGAETQLKDLTSIDSAKVRVECWEVTKTAKGSSENKHCDKDTINYKLVVYAEPPETIFCARGPYFYIPLALLTKDMMDPATAKNYEAMASDWKQICTSNVAPDAPVGSAGTVYLRSVEGVIEYLGALIAGPNKEADQKALKDALGGYTPFDLVVDGTNARFGVSYKGQTYYVRSYDAQQDRTILTLALVNQLLNLNTKATDLPTTRAVEIVP